MNKRIRELAEQAGSTHKLNLGVYQFYTDELEKFAESIIAECAKVARNHTLEKYSDMKNSYTGVVFVEESIKKHFGVEE